MQLKRSFLRHARRAGLLSSLLALVLLPSAVRASPFSFGSIAPSDLIDNLVIGASGPTIRYNSGTGQLILESFITTINFYNRPSISVPAGTLTIRSEVQFVSASFIPIPFSVDQMTAQFTNGLVDYQLIDTVGTGGGPILVLEGDFDGNAVLDAQEITGVVTGSYGGSLLNSSLAGDTDFLSAFGALGGNLSVNPAYAAAVGGNLCGTLVTCGPVASLNSFDVSANGSLRSNNPIPEPSTVILLATGLTGLAIRRR